MPLPSGELLEYGVASGLPMLLSANAFSRVNARREFVGFNLAAAKAIPANVDCALDSAGFVAASVIGDYRWSVDAYLDWIFAQEGVVDVPCGSGLAEACAGDEDGDGGCCSTGGGAGGSLVAAGLAGLGLVIARRRRR